MLGMVLKTGRSEDCIYGMPARMYGSKHKVASQEVGEMGDSIGMAPISSKSLSATLFANVWNDSLDMRSRDMRSPGGGG